MISERFSGNARIVQADEVMSVSRESLTPASLLAAKDVHRRLLSKDYEGLPVTSEAWVRIAMIQLMLRRLQPL